MNDQPRSPELEPEEKSKSQVKREMDALQQLGKKLTDLNQDQLRQVPLDERLSEAIKEFQRLKKHEARRRQLQYIGRLMRDADAEAIAQAVQQFDASKTEHIQHFHQLENWRDRLLDDPSALTNFMHQYPQAEAQQLRQLIRNTQKERKQGKDLGGSRKLFRYLRELTEK